MSATLDELKIDRRKKYLFENGLSETKPSSERIIQFRDVPANHTGWERTRFLVRQRDKFTCQDCGNIRTPEHARMMGVRQFDVHHLNGLCGKKSKGYDRLSDMDGLITLCHKCHFNRPEHASKN